MTQSRPNSSLSVPDQSSHSARPAQGVPNGTVARKERKSEIGFDNLSPLEEQEDIDPSDLQEVHSEESTPELEQTVRGKC